MNERIKELAEQAGLEYDFNPMLWLKYEKFAELIVRECAKIADIAEPFKTSDLILQKFGIYDETLSVDE